MRARHPALGVVLRSADRPAPIRIAYDGTSAPSPCDPPDHERGSQTIVCGFLGCDLRPFNPLIAALPRLLHLARPTPATGSHGFCSRPSPSRTRTAAGSEAMLARMSEMLFVDAVRRHVETLPPEANGLARRPARPLRRTRAGAAARASPPRPGRSTSWAARSGLSRSALHERFVQFVGQPPMQYLAQWRMQLAAALLRGSMRHVAAIALGRRLRLRGRVRPRLQAAVRGRAVRMATHGRQDAAHARRATGRPESALTRTDSSRTCQR